MEIRDADSDKTIVIVNRSGLPVAGVPVELPALEDHSDEDHTAISGKLG
jgi:hypothetical protein